MIIDFHMHLFPDELAQRTIPKLAEISSQQPATNGTLADTIHRMDEWGIDKGVILHIATKPSQQENVNNFAASIQSDRIFSFGSVHPDAPDALDELARIKALGLKGIKLHPDYQNFFVDDPKLFSIYDTLVQLNLPVIFHCGWDPISPDLVHAPPSRLARVLHQFPALTVIGAHLGGMRMYNDVEEYLVGKNIYLEVSMSPRYCYDQTQVARILNRHNPQHLLFGTDCPWGDGPATLKMVQRAVKNEDRLDSILFKNAQCLLNL